MSSERAAQVQEWIADVTRKLSAIADLHHEVVAVNPACRECGKAWPCATARVLASTTRRP